MFTQINIVPRWVIFLLDLIICTCSLIFAYSLKHNLDLTAIDLPELARNLLIIGAINIGVFLHIKTYTGIIRYTSAQDSFRILISVIISNGTFFVLNLIAITFFQYPLISFAILITNGLTSFLLLMTYRVLIKYFFIYVKIGRAHV